MKNILIVLVGKDQNHEEWISILQITISGKMGPSFLYTTWPFSTEPR